MNKADLESKAISIANQFNQVTEDRNKLNEELLRLQGEHRIVLRLIDELQKDVSVQPEIREAEVVKKGK